MPILLLSLAEICFTLIFIEKIIGIGYFYIAQLLLFAIRSFVVYRPVLSHVTALVLWLRLWLRLTLYLTTVTVVIILMTVRIRIICIISLIIIKTKAPRLRGLCFFG